MFQARDEEVQCEWQQVAMILDRFMLYLYLLMEGGLVVYVYSALPHYDTSGGIL